jgi:hypothetical protein
MRGRRRSRSRRSGSGWQGTVVAITAVLVAVAGTLTVAPTTAFTAGTLERGSTAAVADDADGLIGLDVAGSVGAGSSSRLVTVTNQLDRTVTATVTLDSSVGSLSNSQATLAPGESLVASVTVTCDSSPDAVSFTVAATGGTQFTGTATRTTTVDAGGCEQNVDAFRLTDINANAQGNDFDNLDDEYVVFTNTGSTTLDISGWTVRDEKQAPYVVPDGTTVAPNQRVKLITGIGTDTETSSRIDLYQDENAPIWNNGADTVTVETADGRVVLSERYTGSDPRR